MTSIGRLWNQSVQAASVVRLTSFDTSTPDGRSRERYRRAVLAAIAGVAARAISLGATLVTVPLTLHYLGVERYGMWITISSTIALLGFADLGLNNGLVTLVAAADSRDDRDALRKTVSSAFFILTGIAAILGGAFAVAYPFIDWSAVFNVTSPLAAREAGPAVAAFAICFLLNLPLALAERVQMGFQELFATTVWQASGNVLGLGALLLAIYLKAGLPWLVVAMAGTSVMASILNNISLFFVRRPWLRPKLRLSERGAAKTLAATGMLYFTLQLVGAVAYQADALVIAHFIGARQVPQYAVPLRLFMIVQVAITFLLRPLWPAYSEAIANHESAWARRTFLRITRLVLVCTAPAAVFLFLFGKPIIHAWVGPSISPSNVLLLGCGLWLIVSSLAESVSMLLNGASVIAYQIVAALMMAVANLGLSILLVRHIGVAGPLYGSVFAVVLFTLAPASLYIPRLFRSWDVERIARQATA